MDGKISVTVDASVLALPSAGAGGDEVENYVSTLTGWSKLLSERFNGWVLIRRSEGAWGCLEADGVCPWPEDLKKVLAGVGRCDANDVWVVVDRLLSVTPTLEADFGVRDVLTEGEVEIVPDVVGVIPHPCIREDSVRCMVLMAIVLKYGVHGGRHVHILRGEVAGVVKVAARIADVDCEEGVDLGGLPLDPSVFRGELSVCGCFSSFLDGLDGGWLLANCRGDADVLFAVRVALCQYDRRAGRAINWDEDVAVTVGGNFRRSCLDVCGNRGYPMYAKVLRAIAKTIRGDDKSEIHALRESAGGKAQRRRGAAVAWRRDVDLHIHLHYWAEGGVRASVELADVVNHDNFDISE